MIQDARKLSVSHSLFPILNDNIPIFLPAVRAEGLSPFNHDEEHGCTSHADESSGDEAILVSQVTNPWRDPNQHN